MSQKSLLFSFLFLAVFAFPVSGFSQGLFTCEYYVNRTVLKAPVSLLQENSLEGWTKQNGNPVDKGWEVIGGELHRKSSGGDILSEREYGDFVLDFEWKVSKGVNSGVKYRYKRLEKGGWLGPEYQVLDDPNTGEGKNPKRTAASLYDIKPASESKEMKPFGEYNHSRIVVCNDKLEHWLNGKKLVEIKIGSVEWDELISKSKFNEYPDYAKNRLGKIMIQDHGGEVWFKNITIREFEKQTFLVRKGLFGKKTYYRVR